MLYEQCRAVLQGCLTDNLWFLTYHFLSAGCTAKVEVCAFELFVGISGCAPLSINLPLAGNSEGCTAQLLETSRTLVVRLPLRRFTDVLKEVIIPFVSFGSDVVEISHMWTF